MNEYLTPQNLTSGISRLLSVNPVFKGLHLKVIVIANEKAGGFTQKSKSVKNKSKLETALLSAEKKQIIVDSLETELLITEYSGHAEKLVYEFLPEIISTRCSKNKLTMIITAGGDGTSLEVQSGLFKSALESEEKRNAVMNYICVLRLPLGTGNDGSDGHSFSETLEMLESSLHFANARAVKVYVNEEADFNQISLSGKNPSDYGDVNKKSPWFSFNIAGVGLDAFVCYMTNALKSKYPGNHYQMMVRFATLKYNKKFPPQNAVVKVYNKDKLLETINEPFEMVVLGVSGHRTFGAGKKMFPLNDNFAFVKKLNVLPMVMNSGKFTDGTYINTDIAKTYSATKIVLEYPYPILCEMDGETQLLLKENFPLTMELTEPCIRILERDDLTFDRGAVRL
ncbi:MAG: hypothetical protein HUK25_00560 [Treponema sp.]|nr:hypothetical protein [Treponema sp.]